MKLNINGKEIEGILVHGVKRHVRRKIVNGKVYEWIDRKIIVYIPKRLEHIDRYVIIPADKLDL